MSGVIITLLHPRHMLLGLRCGLHRKGKCYEFAPLLGVLRLGWGFDGMKQVGHQY